MNRALCSFFLTGLLLVSLRLDAQLNVPQPGSVRERKITSFQQIFDLKKGVLFVMLYSKKNKIDALRSKNLDKEAADIVENQSKKNKGIIKAFRNHFDFCPVYFFSNMEAEKLLQNKIDSMHFLNDSLIADSSIRPKTEKYFIAEFGMLTQAIYDIEALLIEDKKLIPLKNPFPYSVLMIEDEDRIFEVDVVVSKLNKNLYSFNRTAKRRILKPKFSGYFDEKD